MKEYAIQVTVVRDEKVIVERSRFKGLNVDLLVTEILRYAGVVDVVEGRDCEGKLVFNIYRTGSKGTMEWAKMNSERIRSFGIQASPVAVDR